MSLFQPTTAEDNLRRTEKRLKRLERRPKGGSVGSGQQLVVGTSEFWPGTSTPPAYLIPFDGRTITNGVFTHSALAAVHPEWVSGSDILIPNYGGYTMVSHLPGDSTFGTKGAKVGSKTHTLTVNEMPAHGHKPHQWSIIVSNGGGSGVTGTYGVGNYMNPMNADGLQSRASENTGGGQAHPIVQPSAVGVWCVVAASTIGEYDPIVQAALVAQVAALNTLSTRARVPASVVTGSGSYSLDADGVVNFVGCSYVALNGIVQDLDPNEGPVALYFGFVNPTGPSQPGFELRNAGVNISGGYDVSGAYTTLAGGPTRYSHVSIGHWPFSEVPVAAGSQWEGYMLFNGRRTTGQFSTVTLQAGVIGGGDRRNMASTGWRGGAFDGLNLKAGSGTITGYVKAVKL